MGKKLHFLAELQQMAEKLRKFLSFGGYFLQKNRLLLKRKVDFDLVVHFGDLKMKKMAYL